MKETTALVVIADQDEDERRLLRSILRLKGINVIEARDGQEAINLALDKRPDLLVMDLKLPRVSGSAVIRRIRKIADLRKLPIVAVSPTRWAPGGRMLPGRSTAHLDKPIEFSELEILLDRFLPGQRAALQRV